MLYDAFGWERPTFAHLPLLLKPDGYGKLSKRDGDRLGFPVFPLNWTTADGDVFPGYREQGYFPEAFINMLAFLGWNPGTPQEIFSLDELSEAFGLDRVSKAGAKFDPDKTKWYQQQYLRNTDDITLAQMLSEITGDKYDFDTLEKMCELMKERATFVKDILSEGAYLLDAPEEFDEKTIKKKWKDNAVDLMNEWSAVLNGINDFTTEKVETAFKSFLEEKGLGFGAVLPLYRLLITGKGMGPSMFEISSFLGKDECLSRMEAGMTKVVSIKDSINA